MAVDTNVSQLIINKMSAEQYKEAKESGTLSSTELYFVKEDADSVPTMTPATATADGAKGLVPAPTAGQQDMVLHGDGTWREKANEVLHGRTLAVVNFTEDASGVTVTDLNADVSEITIAFRSADGPAPGKLYINEHFINVLGGSYNGTTRCFIKFDKSNSVARIKWCAANGGVVLGTIPWGKDEIVQTITVPSITFASGNVFVVYEGLSALLVTQEGGIANIWLP